MTSQAGLLSDLVAPRLERREVALWSAAALVVVAAHVGSAWLISQTRAPVPPEDAAPAAIMIELAPMTVAPEAVPLETADPVDSAMVEPSEEPVETAEPVPEETKPVVDPVEETAVSEVVPEQAKPAEPETVETEQIDEVPPEETVAEAPPEETMAEAEEVIPDIVEAPLPEVAMAVPESKPVEKPKPAAKVEKPKPAEKKKTETKPPPKKKPAPQASLAMKKSAQTAPTAAAAGNQGVSGSSMSPARWERMVNRHISRRQRPTRGRGTVQITFSVNAGGDVLSVSVAGSSGDPKLDEAAVSLVKRSSPVPAPPADLPKSRRTIRVPIAFR